MPAAEQKSVTAGTRLGTVSELWLMHEDWPSSSPGEGVHQRQLYPRAIITCKVKQSANERKTLFTENFEEKKKKSMKSYKTNASGTQIRSVEAAL